MDLSELHTHPWFPALAARLEAHIAAEATSGIGPRDGAHDLSHALRVARLAHRIAEEEGADGDVCVAAALLHDLVWVPKNHVDSPRTAELSAGQARSWCEALPGLAPKAAAVGEAILTHSFSGGGDADSLEARVVQDADRLEALGAVGIARVFATGASFGAGLWHPSDPWARSRDLDDKRYSLDHFPIKLLKLEGLLKTSTGRRLARERHELMVGFLAALRVELG
jgi:uncharacterized protein